MTFQLFFFDYDMKFNYHLTEADILTHQLYILSESGSFQKRRARGRMFLVLIYLVTGVFIWQQTGAITAILFYLICLPLYFLYRRMEARQYEKHITNYVHQQFKETLQREFSMEWSDQQLISYTGDNSYISQWMELESVVEIPSLFILNFRNAKALIVPKSDPVLTELIRSDLLTKTESLGVDYVEKLNWKWS